MAAMKPLAMLVLFAALPLAGQTEVPAFRDLFNGKDFTGWVNVNTDEDTWSVKDGMIICKGQPIGVMRTDRQYENFVLHLEWRHMQPGGNSGVFIWSNAVPPEGRRLPNGVEVQALDPEWLDIQEKKSGTRPPEGYISGELFGVGGVETIPDNPRKTRSQSLELRCNRSGQWNTYLVIAVDGTIKLAINGKVVNGVRGATQKKGYICLESEGSEIHFRNIRIMELPPGVTAPEQIAPVLD